MVRVKLNVRYRDLDTLGHVNNAVYLSYIEHARVVMFDEYYRKYGNFHFVIRRVEIDYLKPLYLLDEVEIYAWVSHIGRSSFTIEYEIYNGKGEICAKAKSVQVAYDPMTKTKTSIDPIFMEYLKRYFVESKETSPPRDRC